MARRSLCLATRSLALAALLTSCSAPATAPPAGTSAARPAGTVPIAPTPTTSTAITPTSAPVAAVPADQRSTYDQARLALVEGDLTGATNRLRGLQSASLPPEAAREVRYELAIALSGQGSGADALNVLATPGAIPDDREAFARGLALEVADRHAEAMQSLAEFATANPTVAAAVWLEVAERELNARRPREAADAAGHGLDTASPVSEKQRLLEVRAQALAALGDNQAAFDAHRQVLTLATSDATLGEQLFRLAQVSRDLGQHDAAVQALQTALDRFPQASTTPDALRLLDELGAANEIDAYVLGRARYSAVDYRNAVAAFDAYLQANPDGPDAPSARLYRSLASLTPGNEPNALRELDAIADDPSQDSELAAQALVEAGQVLDGLAEPDQAEQRYAKLLDKFPRLDAAATASFRLGLDRYIRGADADAVAAWDTLVARRDDLGPDDVSRALYWRARALQRLGRNSDARTSMQQAAAVRPAGYYALRAQAQLEPAGTVAPGGPSSQSDADQPELEQFFAARNLNLDSAFQTVAADPALQRAQAEARLGVFREANWEADDLLQRYPDRPDRLYALARDFTDLDLFGGATRLGQAAYAATGVQTPTEAPRALLQAAYPRPFANLTDAAGERYGLDPLLLESTLRDATQFDAWSDDAATGARGLAAMSPIHAEEASLALHAASGRSRAQAVPSPPSAADAIENQAWLLADRLRRYAGRPEAALGAIATTERLADGWLARAGSDDPEVMVESIDYEPVRVQLRDIFATQLTYGIAYAGSGSASAPGDPLHPMLPKPEPTAAWIKIARLAGHVPDPAPLSAEDIGNPDAPDAFQRGTSLARDGNFADAISTFQSAGSNPDPTQAAAAQLRLGQALLGAGRTTEAVSSLQAVDAQQPDQIAAFLLGKAFEALNRCDDAGAALDRFASANPGRLAAQARLAEATCLQSVGRPADAVPLLEQAAQAQDLPRLQQLDFRERLALARLRSGDSDGAIADYSGLLSEARTSSYRSELNYDLGVIAADPSTAVAHFRQAVQLDPKARAARAALDELVARQDSSATSLDAADTRFEQSRYLEALADYSTDQSTARAVYGRGVSLVRLAQDRRGIGVLESMATEFPDTSGAADGLFRAGRIRESLADLDGAANDYGAVIGMPNAGSR
ncbi:MAG: tetratricopeptide repeat protein, partial [Chloroflexi bacterium]|nr:tetratricopeptide repeat protein [Chloroflexota bacterium]